MQGESRRADITRARRENRQQDEQRHELLSWSRAVSMERHIWLPARPASIVQRLIGHREARRLAEPRPPRPATARAACEDCSYLLLRNRQLGGCLRWSIVHASTPGPRAAARNLRGCELAEWHEARRETSAPSRLRPRRHELTGAFLLGPAENTRSLDPSPVERAIDARVRAAQYSTAFHAQNNERQAAKCMCPAMNDPPSDSAGSPLLSIYV